MVLELWQHDSSVRQIVLKGGGPTPQPHFEIEVLGYSVRPVFRGYVYVLLPPSLPSQKPMLEAHVGWLHSMNSLLF